MQNQTTSFWPLPLVTPAAAGFDAARLSKVSELMRQSVDSDVIAGAVWLVARRGGIALLDLQGHANREKNIPMAYDSIMRIYSMSKIITTVAMLQLLEEGRYLLSDPVANWLPELAEPKVALTGADGSVELVPAVRPITFEHLLTHTSGVDYEMFHQVRDSGGSIEQFVAGLRERPLKHQPGECWTYGASTDICGWLVEQLSGLKLDEYFRRNIFEPLGMTDTDFYVPEEKRHRLAVIYRHAAPAEGAAAARGDILAGRSLEPSDTYSDTRYGERPSLMSGGGGLYSTTADYLRFGLMLLGGGTLQGTRILGRKTVELMTSDHLPPKVAPPSVNRRGFGLGVSVLRHLGEAQEIGSVGEFGWGGAACTQAWMDPAEDMLTMVMMQYKPTTRFTLLDRFKQSAYQALA